MESQFQNNGTNTLKIFSEYDNKCICSVLSIDDSFVNKFIDSGSKNIHVIVTTDLSGSMADLIRDSRTGNTRQSKLNLVKIAILNILDFLTTLSSKGHNVSLTLLGFNASVKEIFHSSNLVSDCETIITKINELVADGDTNIGTAIESTETILSQIDSKSEAIVFFITDGYDGFKTNTEIIIEKFITSNKRHMYYGIGLGIAGDYDSEMMNNLFGLKFTGCPLASDATDTMVSTTVSGSSTVFTNVKIYFFDNVTTRYHIFTPLIYNDDEKCYILDKINISCKLPFCLKLVEGIEHDFSIPIIATVTGLNTEGQIVSFDIQLNECINFVTNCDIFCKYFDFHSDFDKLMKGNIVNFVPADNSTGDNILIPQIVTSFDPSTLAIHAGTLLERLQYFVVPENHVMVSFYTDLKNRIVSFQTEMGRINITALNDNEFQTLMNAGRNRLQYMTSVCSQPTNSLSLSRQVSVKSNNISIQTAIRQQSMEIQNDSTQTTHNFDFELHGNFENSQCVSPPQLFRKLQRTISVRNPLRMSSVDCEFNDDDDHVDLIGLTPLNELISNVTDNTSTMDKIESCDLTNLINPTNLEETASYEYDQIDTNDVICKICLTKSVEVITLPCKHVYSCINCSRMHDECAICRHHIDSVTTINVDTCKCVECDGKSNVMFLPCTHVERCEKCCGKIKICGQCNCNITKKIKIYVV